MRIGYHHWVPCGIDEQMTTCRYSSVCAYVGYFVLRLAASVGQLDTSAGFVEK